MEDLLWRYPDDFFPGKGFHHAARQFRLADGGRLDISFRDAQQRLWVVEVKAVPIRIDVADQVFRYAQQLRAAHPADPPIPAVVAPSINVTVREQFDRWGIEYFEITEATFRRVAAQHGEAEPDEPGAGADSATPTGARFAPRPARGGKQDYPAVEISVRYEDGRTAQRTFTTAIGCINWAERVTGAVVTQTTGETLRGPFGVAEAHGVTFGTLLDRPSARKLRRERSGEA